MRLAFHLVTVSVIFLLPLVGTHGRLGHPGPWLGATCALVVLLSQPALDLRETVSRSGTDRLSALAIFVAMIAIQVLSVAQFRISPVPPGGLLVALGAVIATGGLALRLWAIRTLGVHFTSNVRVSDAQPLVSVGPYRRLRHPSYTGALLTALGTTAALGSPAGALLVFLLAIPAYLYRVRVEEEQLERQMGSAYREYQRHTHRLVPGIY